MGGCLQQLSFQVEKRAARSSTLREAVSQASFGSKSASSMIQQKRETHQGCLQQLSFINNESRNAQPEVSAPAHQGCLQQLSFQVEKRAARSSTLQEAVSQASFGSKSASSMI